MRISGKLKASATATTAAGRTVAATPRDDRVDQALDEAAGSRSDARREDRWSAAPDRSLRCVLIATAVRRPCRPAIGPGAGRSRPPLARAASARGWASRSPSGRRSRAGSSSLGRIRRRCRLGRRPARPGWASASERPHCAGSGWASGAVGWGRRGRDRGGRRRGDRGGGRGRDRGGRRRRWASGAGVGVGATVGVGVGATVGRRSRRRRRRRAPASDQGSAWAPASDQGSASAPGSDQASAWRRGRIRGRRGRRASDQVSASEPGSDQGSGRRRDDRRARVDVLDRVDAIVALRIVDGLGVALRRRSGDDRADDVGAREQPRRRRRCTMPGSRRCRNRDRSCCPGCRCRSGCSGRRRSERGPSRRPRVTGCHRRRRRGRSGRPCRQSARPVFGRDIDTRGGCGDCDRTLGRSRPATASSTARPRR